MALSPRSPESGRQAAIETLADDARRFPHLHIASAPDTDNLIAPEAALAVAIHRTVLQRWLTIEHIITPMLRQPLDKMEAAMRAVLLGGAAQLLFMHRLPAYAVVDEMVTLARRVVRPGAGAMVNAVLRRVATLVGEVRPEEPWRPAADVLPLDEGVVRLNQQCLPDPWAKEQSYGEHLALATSHPLWLVRRWLEAFEVEAVERICLHAVRTPPTIVAVERGFDFQDHRDDWQAHETAGFIVWRGDHGALVRFLADHPHRRVQDPAAARAVKATENMTPKTILDYCAGRGTKTVQLAATHPRAQIYAADPDPDRAATLAEVGDRFDNVTVITAQEALARSVELLVLDVPCSNTGVLARRPAARYRLSECRLGQLAALQQQIIEQSITTLQAGGCGLYTTCSIEPEENDRQTRWMEELIGGELLAESLTLPTGHGADHHDGSYHALVR